jgi:hypothetical protein
MLLHKKREHDIFAKDFEQVDPHPLLIVMQNSSAKLENHLLQKNKIYLTSSPHFIPKYLCKRDENQCSQNDFYLNVHSNFLNSSTKLEIIPKYQLLIR